ncbi:branched-chain amino acid ABC transporter permease [Rhodococcus sp. ACT016]|uniref:branched-chain amino acid ABC transporter permease n=1 Tax=Rhodococcus sp. ACT016 TaxID=3134808 RepID=UPI003D2DAF0E
MTVSTTDTAPSRSRPRVRAARGPRSVRELGITVGVLAVVLIWVGPSLYRQDLVFLAAMYGLVALGMYVPFVLAGSLSMAYSAYAAIGAYAVALVAKHTDWSMWWGWIAGAVVSAVVALVLGLVTQRLSGFYLAAVTLLFSLAFKYWMIDARSITGGAGGITRIPPVSVFGWEPPGYLLVAGAVVFVCAIAVLVDRLRKSVWGIILQASRESDDAVRAAGVKPAHLRMVALAIGAAIAAFGGSLFVGSVQAVTPETLTLNLVFLAIFMPIIGGRGTAWGAPLGAVVVVAVTLNMPGYQGSGELLLALAVLLIIIVAPGGLIGYAQWCWTRVQAVMSARRGNSTDERGRR